jgi:myo-inositol-1(or 4)-monophosphatase
MDAPLISSVSPASVNITAEASTGAAQPSMRGADFANLLGHLMDPGARKDIAAAGLIAREAGAAVSDAFGAPLAYNKRDPRAFGLLAAAPLIHAAAVDRLAERASRMA